VGTLDRCEPATRRPSWAQGAQCLPVCKRGRQPVNRRRPPSPRRPRSPTAPSADRPLSEARRGVRARRARSSLQAAGAQGTPAVRQHRHRSGAGGSGRTSAPVPIPYQRPAELVISRLSRRSRNLGKPYFLISSRRRAPVFRYVPRPDRSGAGGSVWWRPSPPAEEPDCVPSASPRVGRRPFPIASTAARVKPPANFTALRRCPHAFIMVEYGASRRASSTRATRPYLLANYRTALIISATARSEILRSDASIQWR